MLANRTVWLDGSEFEPFLYAPVGEDRNGQIVTVLSTLARLGLDPWKEAAALAALGGDAAGSRLGLLLSGFRDVPALNRDHTSVARELTLLLPERPARVTTPGEPVTIGSLMSSIQFWAVVAVLFLLLQILFAGTSQSGNEACSAAAHAPTFSPSGVGTGRVFGFSSLLESHERCTRSPSMR